MISFEMLSEDNVNEVWELEKRCFDDPWELKAFTSELENKISVYFAARDEESGRIVGYAGVWLMYDCADITTDTSETGRFVDQSCDYEYRCA